MKQEKTIETLIAQVEVQNPPEALCGIILQRLHLLERRALRIRLFLLSTVSILSLTGVIASFFSLGRAIARSGFSEYMYLVLSDYTILTTYWKEISLSLLETLPVLSLASALVVIGIFIWSSTKTASNVRSIFRAA
ncbi:MAG: hypothetical protein WC761_02480 [Candidatus Paceibacterota bacterium]|jgi:hypothetical protein